MSSSSQSSNCVHFFKIIDERNLRDGELKVPTSFAKMHWEGMSNPVSLRLPNNTEMKVKWKKHDEGDIWLCNGLKEFANNVSLSEFQLVVFQYQHNSSFNVIVFAKNGSEITYTSVKEEPEEVEESDCSVKILDQPPPSLTSKRSKSLPRKKRKTNPRDQKESHLRNLQSSQQHHKKKKKVEAYSGFDNAAKHLNSGSSSKDPEEKRIKDFHEVVKKDFHPEKEFFTCAMYKTYVNTDQMILPNQFSKLHLCGKDGRSVTLFDVGKTKTWNVQLKKLQNGQFKFTNGWIKFSRENSLKIGDVCAFVLTKTKGISFQVFHFAFEKEIIIPHIEDQEELLNRPSSSSLSPHRTPNSPKVKSTCKSEKEFIFKIQGPSQMTIPIKCIKNLISESEKFATLRVRGNSWLVKVLLYESYSQAKFSQGWSRFFHDCQLKQGDTCYFKLVNEEKFEFEVTIFKM